MKGLIKIIGFILGIIMLLDTISIVGMIMIGDPFFLITFILTLILFISILINMIIN